MHPIFDTTMTFRFPLAKMRLYIFTITLLLPYTINAQTRLQNRERININEGWKFMRYNTVPDKLIYDERPIVTNRNDNVVADTKATDTSSASSADKGLKKWVLPSANDFINDPSKQHKRPEGNPGIEGPGEIIATDNGDPASFVSFASKEREAYFGVALLIVRSQKSRPGDIKIKASSINLKTATINIKSK